MTISMASRAVGTGIHPGIHSMELKVIRYVKYYVRPSVTRRIHSMELKDYNLKPNPNPIDKPCRIHSMELKGGAHGGEAPGGGEAL